jgi:hypothetical protein
MSKRWLVAAAWWAVLAAWFFVPLPAPKPLTAVGAGRGPAPSSLTDTSRFQFPSDSPRATLRVRTDLHQGDIQVELLQGAGSLMVRWDPQGGHRSYATTFSVGKGFRAGTDYQLQVTERNLVGAYRVSFADREGVTRWQRFLALFVVVAVASGLVLAWVRMSQRWQAWRGRAWRILSPTLMMSLGLVYLILHEGGHNLALYLFGALDLGRSDMLGLRGHPHGGMLMGAELTGWQHAVVSIAGPAVPILVGWVLLVLGLTPVGRRIRARRPTLDLFLSMAAALFLFTGVAGAAEAVPMLNPDGDFRGFVENVALPLWAAKAILGAFGLLSFAASIAVARHVVFLVRSMRRTHQTPAEKGSSGGPAATATGDTTPGA